MDYPAGYGKRPMWQWIDIYLIIGGLIYAAVYYLFFASKKRTPYGAAYNPQVTTQSSGQTTITATSAGFQPGNITIKTGDTVIWNNQSGNTSNISSSPHPAHTDYPPLNLGNIAPGASVSLVFPTAGTYKYHNHLNPSQYGSITVQ